MLRVDFKDNGDFNLTTTICGVEVSGSGKTLSEAISCLSNSVSMELVWKRIGPFLQLDRYRRNVEDDIDVQQLIYNRCESLISAGFLVDVELEDSIINCKSDRNIETFWAQYSDGEALHNITLFHEADGESLEIVYAPLVWTTEDICSKHVSVFFDKVFGDRQLWVMEDNQDSELCHFSCGGRINYAIEDFITNYVIDTVGDRIKVLANADSKLQQGN
ncbi:hypothetical protein B5F76_07850 [Desulfovibrio sp. An276]|uniref:hypothetical protein n=1 Tax=Desulfovibrio sp. An276 TaxID=1965618 RepID=UPI000B378435|nr:hypothetical protein [Desulfovibrio sp. An276]OUO52331.1 hypothetical protein B5F76_07850 [Desulfovibrio sp. An276]